MTDSDPGCIFSLIPKAGSVLALDACHLPHNQQYLVPDNASKSHWNREQTPVTCDGNEYDEFYRNTVVRFPFGRRPGIPVEFGSNPKSSHFLLQNTRNRDEIKRRGKWASQQHFRITFDHEARLVLYSYPNAPAMRVSYDGQLADAESKRHGVTWILFAGVDIEIIINDECVFKILVPPHDPSHIVSYLRAIHEANALPSILNLNLETQPTTAADSKVPTRGQPLYFTEWKAGEGRHGRVYIVINVHTGFRYAKKVAFPNSNLGKEIAILRSLSHERIIQIFDFDEAGRFFFMEYLSWGSLKDEHRRSPFTNEEVALICGQGLEGMGYLHNIGIALRDIKPEDVLLSSPRENLSIKFVDFSTAALLSDGEHYKTFCGNPRFSAPEIFVLGKYEADKADLWSWGLNILALLHRLPWRPDSDETSLLRDQAKWFMTLFGWMGSLEKSGLVGFLLTNLLEQEPGRRKEAGKCLDILRKSGLYVPAAVTPTEVSSPRSPMSHHEEAYDPDYPIEFHLASNAFNRLSPNHSLPSTSCSRRSLGLGLSQQDNFRSVIELAGLDYANEHKNQDSYLRYKRKGSTLSSGSVNSSGHRGKRSTGYPHLTSQRAQDSHHQQYLSGTANLLNSQVSTRRSHGSSQSHLEAMPVTALLRGSIFADEDIRTERATSGHPSLRRSHLDGVPDPDAANRPFLSPDPSVFSLLAGSPAWSSLGRGHASQSKRNQRSKSSLGSKRFEVSRSGPRSSLQESSFVGILEQAAEDTHGDGEELWSIERQYHHFQGPNKVYSQPEPPRNVLMFSENGWVRGQIEQRCLLDSDRIAPYSSHELKELELEASGDDPYRNKRNKKACDMCRISHKKCHPDHFITKLEIKPRRSACKECQRKHSLCSHTVAEYTQKKKGTACKSCREQKVRCMCPEDEAPELEPPAAMEQLDLDPGHAIQRQSQKVTDVRAQDLMAQLPALLQYEESGGFLIIKVPYAPKPSNFVFRISDQKLSLTRILQMAGFTTSGKRTRYYEKLKQNGINITADYFQDQGLMSWVDLDIGLSECLYLLPESKPDLEYTLRYLVGVNKKCQ